MILIKRVYEAQARSDGKRFLVERLWPRGVRKETLEGVPWLKDVAPSTALRTWFGHQVERWDEFRKRYEEELAANREAWEPLLAASRRGAITLLYSAHDVEHNGALVLQDFLRRQR